MDFDSRSIRQIGRFPVLRLLGEGTQGFAYEVEDPELFGVRRALMLSKPDAVVREHFELVARALVTIRHPNLIPVHDFGRDEPTGLPFLTMEFVEGGALADVRTSWQVEAAPTRVGDVVLSLRQIVRCLDDVLSVLERLHRADVIHRDLKPANVLLTPDGIAMLSGLGIATFANMPRPDPEGQVLGTPLYMAPEAMRGERADPRSDLFSLGLTLYRVLAARSVYQGAPGVDLESSRSVVEYVLARTEAGGELELDFPEQVPSGLRDLIRDATRMNPRDRFRDAAEMRAALDAASGPASARPASTERRLAAVVKTDIVGYARLIAEDEAGTVRAIRELDDLADSLARKFGGRLVDFTGDNFLAEFPATVAAARFALAVQEEAESIAEPQIQLRMGIHLGDVRVEGQRIFGSGINVAARLEPLAEPRGICVSGAVREQLRGTLDLDYEDLGERELKNLPDPVRVFRVVNS